MHTELDHLTKLFRGVRNIRGLMKQYAVDADMSQPSIDDLKVAFEQEYGVKIKFGLVPELTGNLLRGAYVRKGDDVFIYVDEALSEAWSRYIVVKEMCHLILNDPEYMTQDPVALIELMIFEETNPVDGNAPLDLVSDMWARRAAHEFIFPMECRAAAADKIAAGDESALSTAREFGVPQHLIEQCLNHSYDATCKEAWSEMNDEHYVNEPKAAAAE